MSAQRDALGRRLGGIKHRERARCLRALPERAARKEAAGVAVVTQAQEDEVELADRLERRGVALRRFERPELGGHRVSLMFGDRHVVQPRRAGHLRIALRVVARGAALIAEIDVPARPVRVGGAQRFVHAARRVAAGKDDDESTAVPQRFVGGSERARSDLRAHRAGVGHRMPAALLNRRGKGSHVRVARSGLLEPKRALRGRMLQPPQ